MGKVFFSEESAARIADAVRRVEGSPAQGARIFRRGRVQSGEGGGGVPVKLTEKNNDTTYTGDIYANGLDATATETGVTIRVSGMATGATLPNAVPFHAHKEKWAGVPAWTLIGVSRWL
jgi:hypothetical protein